MNIFISAINFNSGSSKWIRCLDELIIFTFDILSPLPHLVIDLSLVELKVNLNRVTEM